jgi:hypothetical protein
VLCAESVGVNGGVVRLTNDRRLSMNSLEANENCLLSEAELDEVIGGNAFVAWGIALAGCAADALTDGAFSRPLSLDSIRQTMGG